MTYECSQPCYSQQPKTLNVHQHMDTVVAHVMESYSALKTKKTCMVSCDSLMSLIPSDKNRAQRVTCSDSMSLIYQ